MVNNLQLFSDNPLRVIYKPSELLGMFTSYLSKQDVNLKNNISSWNIFKEP